MIDDIKEKLLSRNFEPIRKNIIFKFCSNLTHNNFQPISKGGIIIQDMDYDEHAHPQYGEVVCCGPDVCDEIKQAKYILIEEGRWTNKIRFGDKSNGRQYLWKTDEDSVMAVAQNYISWH